MTLPELHNPLLVLAVILAAGVVAGNLARRLHLPSVTGQILVGVLLGPSVLRLLGPSQVHALQPITHFALGLIAVAVGSHLNVKRLRNATQRLAWLLLLEATVTPLLVFGALMLFPSMSWPFALLLAAMAVSTAPATVVALVKETHARGVFVKTLIAAVALNNMAAILLFEVAHNAGRVALDPAVEGFALVLLSPFRELLFSALLGAVGAGLLAITTRHVVRADHLSTASLVAILLTVGLAQILDFSSLLSCLFLGIFLVNLVPDKEDIGHAVFDDFEGAILAVFFVLAGAELDFGVAAAGGALALVVVAARMAGKVLAARGAMQMAGATRGVRHYLGLALVPQAGVAVGLMLVVSQDPAFAALRDLFLAVGLGSVLLNEIIGPVLTRFALHRAGDAGRDRPRLIDFLHEENIVTDLQANTKEEVFERLVELLVSSHHLRVDRSELLASILEREEEISTAVGGGLMIPHGRLSEGERILGVMGISREGLPLESPDDHRIHCVVLLATPDGARDHHLEVLGALARSIGSERSLQRQLYHAKSPAHAYEVLHAEESEDFNYFLEE